MTVVDATAAGETRWNLLAEEVLAGRELTRAEGLAILRAPDVELPALLAAAFRVRRRHFGLKVHLYYLKNAKSGLCPEDCGYCSQSIVSEAPIDRYPLLNEDRLLEGARQAAESRARTYCIVASGRGPNDREVGHIAKTVERIKAELGLHICCCLGLLSPDQAKRLKEAGVDRINHNLNTSRRFYSSICSTHSFDDRIETLRVVREAGMELCCGLVVGMGEVDDDIVDVAIELRSLGVESIPVNFLNSIEGTPLEAVHELNPRYCLKTLCLLRLMHPSTEIRIAGGREVNLRSMQAQGLYAANSMFVSDYLTTKGQAAAEDFQMVEDLGFEVVTGDAGSNRLRQEQPMSSRGATAGATD
jgi:biotin synthase